MNGYERNQRDFERFDQLLKSQPLKREDGSESIASANEFMLMKRQENGCVQFKHRVTRNYVVMVPGPWERRGSLHIPATGRPFERGEF